MKWAQAGKVCPNQTPDPSHSAACVACGHRGISLLPPLLGRVCTVYPIVATPSVSYCHQMAEQAEGWLGRSTADTTQGWQH